MATRERGVEARLVSAEGMGKLIGVCPATIRTWARAGLIPAVRLPGHRTWRFDADEVLAALKVGGKDSSKARAKGRSKR